MSKLSPSLFLFSITRTLSLSAFSRLIPSLYPHFCLSPLLITSFYILSKMNDWKPHFTSCILKSPPLQSGVSIIVNHCSAVRTIEEQILLCFNFLFLSFIDVLHSSVHSLSSQTPAVLQHNSYSLLSFTLTWGITFVLTLQNFHQCTGSYWYTVPALCPVEGGIIGSMDRKIDRTESVW